MVRVKTQILITTAWVRMSATYILLCFVVLGNGLPTLEDKDTETVINKPLDINGNEEAVDKCFDNVFLVSMLPIRHCLTNYKFNIAVSEK